MERKGRGRMMSYNLAFLAWLGGVWAILKITGWGFDDPAYWGLIILSMPVGMVAGAFLIKGKRGKK